MRPPGAERRRPWKTLSAKLWRELRGPVLVVVGIVGAAALYGRFAFGSVGAALAAAQGYVLYCEESTVWVGAQAPGEKVMAEFTLNNLTNRPVRIVGARTTCGCLRVEDLPRVVPIGESTVLRVAVVPSAGAVGEPFQEGFRLYVDVPSREVKCRVAGTRGESLRSLDYPQVSP